MGSYNPHTPLILGQEWVPIRDENLIFSPVVNTVERGVTYDQAATQRIADARFYVNQIPAPPNGFQTAVVNIYPAGTEDETGPIREIIIPCNSGAITGTNISLFNSASVAEAVFIPGDSKYIEVDYNSGTPQRIGMFFAVNSYPELANKRILNVSLIYSGAINDQNPVNGDVASFINPDPGFSTTVVDQMNDAGTGQTFSPPTFLANTGVLDQLAATVDAASLTTTANQVIGVMNMGDINNFWNPPASVFSTEERVPWRYVDLQRFEASAPTNRQMIRVTTQIPQTALSGASNSVVMRLDYFALRVIYCEEKRVAYGGRKFINYQPGANVVTLRDSTLTANPSLPAGHYLPTLSWVSPGQITFGSGLAGQFPGLNALQELYATPDHQGVEVAVPFPLANRLGSTFTSKFTHVLPQLTLHASGTGTMTEPHVYGRQAAAQVYGVNTATQEIYDDISGINASYPQVRYYARRFGDTTVPLMLTGTGVFTGSTVSITPTDFDALVEILDGWREVTLRFTNAPTMGAATGTPGWTWSAFGETSGNRWEILAACAPAVSGIPGNLYNLVPAPNQLTAATYQPPAGATVELTWMPQGIGSVYVTGSTIDATTDAVLIFSQDPATVTGVALTARTQTVTGFALDCGSLPCCIPTGIPYQQISWSHQGLTTLVEDAFGRVVANGFGSPDVGAGPYVLTDVATAYQVNGTEGTITPTVINTDSYATLDVGSTDFDVTAQMGVVGNMIVGSTSRAILVGRFTSGGSGYTLFLQQVQSTGAIVLAVAGGSSLVTATVTTAIDGGARVNMRFMGQGTLLKAKVWPQTDPEPISWDIEFSDSVITTGTRAGVGAQSRGVLGNTVGVDNLRITVPSFWFGGYELQRYDTVEQAFDTIMLATDIMQTSFNDYESRVGINSVYRIRALNALNFAGPWSLQVTGSVPTPGVTGGCSDSTGALIFTSNADQTGLNNAAFVMQWDGAPIEDFKLPEADMVQYQPMYGRDGSIAFHGTERGLESFDRTLLLAAAAIDPVRLADAKTIRDLAWANLPYVCVRDDIGDRWFASIQLPTVNSRLNRTKYFARVEIIEVTQTPAVIDP